MVVQWVLRLVVVIGLAVDAEVHLRLAGSYDAVKTSVISQGTLFRIEGASAIVAALLILAVRRSITALIAFAVAAGGAVAVVVYATIDPGQLGPLPDMYEPVWFSDKVISVVGETAAAVAALVVVYRRKAR